MNFNTDGFNERTNYIRNSNDLNKLKQSNLTRVDNSFAKMKVEENRTDIKTYNNDKILVNEEVRGNKENFVIRTNNIKNANSKVNPNNPVQNALNKNMFNNMKKF